MRLDPKSQLALLLTVSGILMQCSMHGLLIYLNIILLFIPIIFLIKGREYKNALKNSIIFVSCLLCQFLVLPRLHGMNAILLAAVIAMFIKIMPGIILGFYIMRTIEVAELIDSLEKLHMPRVITWTISLVFRFFPTVIEELSATYDGVRIRGCSKIHMILHPLETLEYVYVPLIVSVVNIGNELLIATLTKGFSINGNRSSIAETGFSYRDYLVIAFVIVAWTMNFILK